MIVIATAARTSPAVQHRKPAHDGPRRIICRRWTKTRRPHPKVRRRRVKHPPGDHARHRRQPEPGPHAVHRRIHTTIRRERAQPIHHAHPRARQRRTITVRHARVHVPLLRADPRCRRHRARHPRHTRPLRAPWPVHAHMMTNHHIRRTITLDQTVQLNIPSTSSTGRPFNQKTKRTRKRRREPCITRDSNWRQHPLARDKPRADPLDIPPKPLVRNKRHGMPTPTQRTRNRDHRPKVANRPVTGHQDTNTASSTRTHFTSLRKKTTCLCRLCGRSVADSHNRSSPIINNPIIMFYPTPSCARAALRCCSSPVTSAKIPYLIAAAACLSLICSTISGQVRPPASA